MQLDNVLAYLEKVTTYDRQCFTPLFIGGEPVGCLNDDWKNRLLQHESLLFKQTAYGVECTLKDDYSTLSQSLAAAANRWKDTGWLNGWRNENFTAFHHDGTPLLELERAAFRPLGLTSRAVHLNGLCKQPDGEVVMWIGRRSPDKAVDPNRMDNLMGGGIAAGEDISTALLREGWEEAGITADKLSSLSQRSVILAERPVLRGLHREWLYVFDLWLHPGEIPCNQDGEVAEHVCLTLAEVEQLLVDERFMIDAALVTADCMARLQYWGADSMLVLDKLARLAQAPANHVEIV